MRRETFPFTLPLSQIISDNRRYHHHARARLTRDLRLRGTAAWGHALSCGVQPMQKAHVTAWFTWPDARRRDDANYNRTLKALIDGLVAGLPNRPHKIGLLPDDDAEHLIGPDPRRAGVDRKLAKPVQQVRIELAFQEVEA